VASERACAKPPTPRAAWVHQIHAAGEASSSTTMVMVFVCLCFLCRLVWSSSLVVCRRVREICRQVWENNLKVGLKTLLCAPPTRAPHLLIVPFVWTVVMVHGSFLQMDSALRSSIPSLRISTLSPTVIVVNTLIIFMVVTAISLALPIVSNFMPVSYEWNVKEHVSSEYSCTWWGF